MADVDEYRKYLLAEPAPMDLLNWLGTTFFSQITEHLNTNDIRKRLSLYAGEKIPENERNLTDVRNRISLIIEYETARIATRLLEELKITDIFWSYVVANRFPDLEVRTVEGARGIRVEVKCIQMIAEEPSANFDTLIKDIDPENDFVVVFLWDWRHDPGDIQWVRAPYIYKAYVFHATSLAFLRDWYWLNRPPKNLGEGKQGFDLRYAVTCSSGNYSEEEGNYGKILRLWKKGFSYALPESKLYKQTAADYLQFKDETILAGFNNIAQHYLPILAKEQNITAVMSPNKQLGWRAGDMAFFMGSQISGKAKRQNLLLAQGINKAYFFTATYSWTELELQNGSLVEIRKGKKPKHLISDQA